MPAPAQGKEVMTRVRGHFRVDGHHGCLTLQIGVASAAARVLDAVGVGLYLFSRKGTPPSP